MQDETTEATRNDAKKRKVDRVVPFEVLESNALRTRFKTYIEKNQNRLFQIVDEIKLYLPAETSNDDEDGVVDAIAKKTDVSKGKYEGGFKLWEASIDLSEYLLKTNTRAENVLELGCGAGLPSLTLVAANPSTSVTFADLNTEVLMKTTIPNVVLNLGVDVAFERHAFVAGDWSVAFLGAEARKFELVLMSETLYFEDAHDVLLQLLKRVVAPNGICLIASKRFYFGCGGGVSTFQKVVEADGHFVMTIVKTVADGVSNVRDVVRLEVRPPLVAEDDDS